MLNWIRFLSVFLLTLFVTITIIVFYQAEKPFASSRDAAIDLARQEGKLQTVDRADVYHGTASLVSVYGIDEEGKDKILLVDEQAGKVIRSVTPKKGITKQEAADIVKKEDKVKKILHSSLGQEKENLFWEVAYIGEDDSLNYVYLNFTDGEWRKRIMNL
ncbi:MULTISPECIES: cell wall elongation regulator TseB-like domain-containing protein [Sporosarcina]|uniref:cell wall elongation regulator TseB-like domain-containing protein n=1 Tax=Sporosarcina TaxID=1569 RepID=UPI00129AEBC8|nr:MULTISPECIES: DUF5590 domain-containing protein [Sporosarcina]GKV67171.1 hypothetical protein NCCP2331_33240 [Sporosarcina sp. NCCP-2331]GLB57489.1 hypothetical protein NCCP2378_32770 [Sporosarcina sp. NCCP-2378]